jgi:hypothetical protein
MLKATPVTLMEQVSEDELNYNFDACVAGALSPLGSRWHRQLLRWCWEAHS